ncbi:MAG: PAS domain S-box protein [Pseudomonadota bacterium]
MADDEALREALLELKLLRDRETAALRTTEQLLSCLEVLNSTADPSEGARRVLERLKPILGADQVIALEVQNRTGRLIAQSGTWPEGTEITFPFDPVRKSRNLVDRYAMDGWGDATDVLSGLHSLLVQPMDGRVLIALAAAKGAFTAENARIFKRVSVVVGQALAAAKLADENRLLAATIQGSSSGFAIADAKDPEKPLLYVNAAFEALSGYSADEVLGENCRFLNDEPAESEERLRLRETVANNGAGRFLLRNRRKSGEPFWNELTLFPVRTESGEATHLVATQTDATVRVQAEEDRERLRKRMEAALRATGDAFLILARDGTVLYANSATAEQFPARPSNWAIGSRFDENWAAYLNENAPSVNSAVAQPDFLRMALGQKRQQVQFPDGRTFLVTVAETEEGPLAIHATNVTALKVTERLSEQRLTALDAARDGIALVDDSGRIVSLNPSAAQLLGFQSQPDALGVKWQRRYDDAPKNPRASSILSRSDQTQRYHEVNLSETDEGQVLIIRDVTDRREEEDKLRSLNSALAIAQRREATAQLASGLAHDFNNTLSAIMGSASLISIDRTVSDDTRSHADRISAAGRSAAKLVNRLLDLGSERANASLIDLRSLVRELPALVKANLPSHISLTTSMSDRPLIAEAQASEISQILLNLALNARDAIGEAGGTIAVSAQETTPDRARDLTVGTIRRGQAYAVISVSDTGSGIPDDIVEKVFEPYFSTKGDQGTGLGLAIAATQVRVVGGAINVTSSPGTGTKIEVFWPLSDEALVEAAAQPLPSSADLSGKTLLVVDDEEDVAEVLRAYLEKLGAEVAVTHAAEDAAEAISDDPEAWSALITDYDMPGMTGGDLVAKAREVNPALPIFVVTALARRITDPRLSRDMITGLFAKPVDLRHLAGELAKATTPNDP